MKVYSRFIFLLCFCLAETGVVSGAEIKLAPPELEKLPNGLEVAWFVNQALPVVDLTLVVKTGYRDDPAEKSGTAELVANTLDRGAAGFSAQAVARSIEMLGAGRYSVADEDSFSVGMHGLAPDANVLLEWLGKIALHPDFMEAEVSREHGRLIDRWMHIADSSDTLATLAYHRLIASGTPYGRGNFLSIDEFKKVGRADVVAFYKKYFVPANSVLMVVGKVNTAAFRSLVRDTFGLWRGAMPEQSKASFYDPRLPKQSGKIVLIDRPGHNQAQIRVGFRAPLITVPERHALTVANSFFGEYFNSRLNSIIRDKLGLSYGISSSFSYSKDLALFTIASSTRNESAGKLIETILQLLRELKAGPIGDSEVKMAKDYLVGGFPLSVATLSAVAGRWSIGYLFGLGSEFLNEFTVKIAAVKADEVSQAVKKYFDIGHLYITVSGDADEIKKSLALSKFKNVLRISAKDLM